MRFALAFVMLLALGAADAQPARDEVVARNLLPPAVKKSVAALVAQSPVDQSTRIKRAQALLTTGRAEGDPRTLGYAEALLAGAEQDADVLVLRATIEQSRHRFAEAVQLLDQVLSRNPRHPQALVTRATVATVTANYERAMTDCRALQSLHADAGAICSAQVAAVTGGQENAGRVLEIARRRTDGPLLAWALALQGQLAEQRGDSDAAVGAYRASLRHANDLTTRLALVDVLLAKRDFGAVADLLRDAPPVDGVLVRRWRMTHGVGEHATLLEEQLAQRFNEARARGEFLHAREAADFALTRGRHDEALQLARDNWRTQREPADLLVLARAARAVGDPGALNEVRATLRRTGLQDVRIERALGAGKGVTA